MRCVLVLAAAALLSPISFSVDIHVPDDFTTIQGAIDAASGGDTIVVRAGTYFETIDFLGKDLLLTGESGSRATVIDGGFTGSDSTVTFSSGESAAAIFEGFTVRNGQDTRGGGILCDNASNPTIRNNWITDNSAHGKGGAIACRNGSSPLIENNTIPENGADRGGAIYCSDSSPTIRGNVIGLGLSGNGSKQGGAIYLDNSSPLVIGNRLSGNSSLYGGGGINCDNGSRPVIADNIIAGNRGYTGAGIACEHGSQPTITGNTITGNIAYFRGGAIYLDDSSAALSNTILWNNDGSEGSEICVVSSSILTFDFSDAEGGLSAAFIEPGSTLTWGTGNIEADPLFVDDPGADFHITWNSPCRNSGDNAAVTGLFDFEGDPRIHDGTADMGADEFHLHLYSIGDVIPGSSIEMKVVGVPGLSPLTLGLGSGIQKPPQSTPYGDLYLQLPIVMRLPMPDIGSNGLSILSGSIPANWLPGEQYPFQVLAGSDLTNLTLLTVE